MRVIAGSAGGIPLHVPRTDLRPTMDQVRAAIFSSLGDAVIGANVLDLFAGTGALGIEALSRGARAATFVERDRHAVGTITRNLEKTRLASPMATVVPQEVFAWLNRRSASSRGETFDLIFADPPYAKTPSADDPGARLLEAAILPALLTAEGRFVLEKAPRRSLPETTAARWEVLRQKRYGGTEVVFLRPVREPDPEEISAGADHARPT